jgi:hypothetical protein
VKEGEQVFTNLWNSLAALFSDFRVVFTPDNTLAIIVNLLGYAGVIVAGYLGYRAVERRLRKEHTVDVLIRLLITPEFAGGLHILDNHIARDLFVVEDKLKEDDNIGDPTSLDMLMNFYEFMASAYRRNLVDKRVIENQNIKHIHDSYIVLEELIKERRDRWDRPTYMKEFQLLAEQFGPKMKSALGIDDPLTRKKMLRNPRNKDRLHIKNRDSERELGAAA